MKILPVVFSAFLLSSVSTFALTRIQGEIHAIDIDNRTFTIKEKNTGALHVLDFKDSTTIRIDDRRYQDMSHLEIGEDVVYQQRRRKPLVEHIEVTIESLDKQNRKVTYVDSESGERMTLPYDNRAKRGVGFGNVSIERLRPGQVAILEIVRK